MNDVRRLVPRTDTVLADARLVGATARLGRTRVKDVVVATLQRVRDGEVAVGDAIEAAVRALPPSAASGRRVLNATGVVLHTNLGRAPLSLAARDAVATAAGYVDVEFDLATGQRARRGRGALAALAAAVPAAGAVHVVNNGAAALVLATTVLGQGREIVVSRGEMVEIGDGFRLPDLIESTGARLREVGTTNRTNVEDYRRAVGPDTGAILKVHPSNFRVEGFTSSVTVGGLAGLDVAGRRVPVIADVGSGLLVPNPLLPDEPDVTTALEAGASVVTCSGDKLLGGPQAGLLFGEAVSIDALRRHPLARALRVDKLTLAALEATVTGPPTPTWLSLEADPQQLRQRCAAIVDAVADSVADAVGDGGSLPVEVIASDGAVGGGAGAGVALPGWAVAVPALLAEPLRTGALPVVGRIENGRLLLDLRCVEPSDDAALVAAVRAAAATRH